MRERESEREERERERVCVFGFEFDGNMHNGNKAFLCSTVIAFESDSNAFSDKFHIKSKQAQYKKMKMKISLNSLIVFKITLILY